MKTITNILSTIFGLIVAIVMEVVSVVKSFSFSALKKDFMAIIAGFKTNVKAYVLALFVISLASNISISLYEATIEKLLFFLPSVLLYAVDLAITLLAMYLSGRVLFFLSQETRAAVKQIVSVISNVLIPIGVIALLANPLVGIALLLGICIYVFVIRFVQTSSTTSAGKGSANGV